MKPSWSNAHRSCLFCALKWMHFIYLSLCCPVVCFTIHHFIYFLLGHRGVHPWVSEWCKLSDTCIRVVSPVVHPTQVTQLHHQSPCDDISNSMWSRCGIPVFNTRKQTDAADTRLQTDQTWRSWQASTCLSHLLMPRPEPVAMVKCSSCKYVEVMKKY